MFLFPQNTESTHPGQTSSPVTINAHKSEVACIAVNQSGTLLATASMKVRNMILHEQRIQFREYFHKKLSEKLAFYLSVRKFGSKIYIQSKIGILTLNMFKVINLSCKNLFHSQP